MMERDSETDSQANIFQSSATYYNPAARKWESGSFTLNKKHIQFICNTNEKEQYHLVLPLSTVTEIKKRQSSLIYPSLVVSVRGEKHWFSSFQSRDAIYNLLELFWRESLLSKPLKTLTPRKNLSSSPLGQELFKMLHESESALIETANTLSDQSRQLHESEQDVIDLNNVLNKAEEAIKKLSIPLSLPSFRKNDNNGKTENLMQKYKVTFSFSNTKDKVDWEKGILIITDELILVKVDENVVMQVTKDELETIQILSPWELCITHTFSDLQKKCFFMCPQLSRLLKFISFIPYYKEKTVYADDDSSAYETASSSSRSSIESAKNAPSSPNIESKTVSESSDQTQLKSLSEEDFQELQSVLQNLQTLSTEVGREQENQLQRINALAESMEKTEMKIKNVNNSAEK